LTIRLLALAALACAAVIAQAQPLIVGAVVSRSGAHASLAEDYRRGLELWQEQINAAGGLLGRAVELRVLDDGSEAVKAGRLYAELAGQKAEVFIGPYGSAATLMAGAEAERAKRVMVHASSSKALQKRGGGYVFSAVAPYASYATGVLELAKAQGLRQIFLVSRDDPGSREMAEGAREAAAPLGLTAMDVVVYRAATSDFRVQVQKAEAANAEAWIAFGEARDAADMARTFRRLGYAPRLFFARAAADPSFIKMVGQDAEYTLAFLEYDTRLATPGNREFVEAYTRKWSAPPKLAAAQAFAAATVLADGVQRAGSTDPEKLRPALAEKIAQTVLGAPPTVAQIQNGRPVVVWPQGAALQPYPQWNERQVIKR
jgi:branched-chain amino acid transport system substrate-binding protein